MSEPCLCCSLQVNEEEVDPAQYRLNRLKHVETLKANKISPYPHKFQVSVSLIEFIEKFKNLEDGQQLEDVTVSIAGRLTSKRSSGSKLHFYDVQGEGVKVNLL